MAGLVSQGRGQDPNLVSMILGPNWDDPPGGEWARVARLLREEEKGEERELRGGERRLLEGGLRIVRSHRADSLLRDGGGGGLSATLPSLLFYTGISLHPWLGQGLRVMCCWSNTDNKTGLGLSPLQLPASVTQSRSDKPFWGH